MSDIRIDIRFEGATQLKVVWTDTLQFPPYYVDIGPVKQLSQQIRARLQTFVTDAMTPTGTVSHAGAALRDLAQLGRNLYDALFLDAGRSEVEPERIETWFRQRQAARLLVSVDSRIHVPWGLIFGGDPASMPLTNDLPTLLEHAEFWCLKHKLATVHYRITPDRVDIPYSTATLQVLRVLHRQAFDTATAAISPEEQQTLAILQDRFGGAVYDSPDFRNRWAASVGLLYFYCHADGTKLALGPDDVLDATSLQLLFKKTGRGRTDACMVFLNGCSTATGHPDGAFLEATGQQGMCGFIGTESVVPDVFALRFSLAFLTLFLQSGRPVYDIMHELWVRHFPLSLLYSIYTYPLLRVDHPADEQFAGTASSDNFSLGTLGSQQL